LQTAGSPLSIIRKPFQLSVLEKAIREALQRAMRDDGGHVLQFTRRAASKRE
jgi:hypothetical protein